ncbi:LysR family transcriptional regulator [Clostridium sporogenes]|uniref:LysR family transcriptional regulator n=1 Tax=Clostridium TaxID=1485 RepID=UPI0005EFD75B|nr:MULTISPECIES: LysR family transcriptional regulator [Clostridium]MBE6055861.1 LysR family transcriptional regulator [Clostridium sp.]MBW5457641.1 LysR family transcriptional regulator [Clostridium sporogenes]NFQ03790.1 LysR family transcriptional regulator [Clostridium sporogenes]NFQ43046.1 LysR family transcriptional regulator [Clostridium sporogenes]NFT01837.1 LysR family transcriptional regulator [Clostridium sporogenes]
MISKLDLYRVFGCVGKCKSFSKAAKELYMTQPAVSQSIMQLEKELSIRLFTRTPKGVILTNEGEILFEYVTSAISLIEAGEKKMLDSKNLMIGDLKIGVGDTTSKYFLLSYLEEFHIKYPNVKLKILNGTTVELCNLVKTGDIDLAICNLPIEDSALEFKKCMEIQDIFVCGERFNKTISEPLSFVEISKMPLILLDGKSNSRQYVENYLLSKGVNISPEIELGAHDLLLQFAKINLGIACVVKEFSLEYLEQKILFEVKTKEPIPKRNIGFCYLKSVSLSPAARTFLESL